MLGSLPFLGLMGVMLGSMGSFSFPFLRMGLREGVLASEGRVACGGGTETQTKHVKHYGAMLRSLTLGGMKVGIGNASSLSNVRPAAAMGEVGGGGLP